MESRSQVVMAVTIATITCATTFVFFRMVSRIGIVKKVQADDYFMLVAWNPALMATKTSILIFYLTLSRGNKTFWWFCIGTLFVVNAAGIALTLLNIFQCRSVGAAFMTPVPKDAHCTDIVTIYLSSAPVNIITDLAILFLPMPILTGMRLPRKQKTILVITFGFGAFVAIVDVVRIAYLQQASVTRLSEMQTSSPTPSGGRDETDFSWYASLSFMWSAIEVNIGIMCACVPALKPLVSRFIPKMLRDAGDGTEKSVALQSNEAIDMAVAHRIPSMPEAALKRYSPPALEPAENDGPMGMMDFLTTPDMDELPAQKCERTQTAMTNTSRATPPATPTFFDFVNLKGKKSMVQMTNRESLFPVAMVTVLFFIWGFEYGLLDVLNSQFQLVARMSAGQSIGIHSAYFGGYLFGPLTVGRLVLKHWGFKACYIVGLCTYACGTLIFWPSAVLTSFPAFLVSNFIVGFGLSILEVAANPFIALCGPPRYSEIRLNISQGVQAIGSI
ncbi:hypothetical protein LTR66_015014, partial [Elasticomyces elasticus]